MKDTHPGYNPTIKVDGKTLRGTLIWPEVPESFDDIYLIATMGDRFDILAKEYYKSTKYWKVIAAANPLTDRGSLYITPGLQIRIPLPLQRVKDIYNKINRSR